MLCIFWGERGSLIMKWFDSRKNNFQLSLISLIPNDDISTNISQRFSKLSFMKFVFQETREIAIPRIKK